MALAVYCFEVLNSSFEHKVPSSLEAMLASWQRWPLSESQAFSATGVAADLGNLTNVRCPLFVTWNVIDSHGKRSLRGCIGTFEDQPMDVGLSEYALIA